MCSVWGDRVSVTLCSWWDSPQRWNVCRDEVGWVPVNFYLGRLKFEFHIIFMCYEILILSIIFSHSNLYSYS